MITPQIKTKIQKILNAIETSKPDGDYGKLTLFEDGPNKIKQITYGKTQTTEWGNLSKLINLYVEKKGDFADNFRPYLDKIGKVSLVNDKNFISILKNASKDEVMKIAQDEFFDEVYWKPALKWFETKKLTLPLSMLVIYDSFIHSGSILKFLRNKFPETTPENGGDEKVWIQKYVEVRHEWLSNHSDKMLRNSSYRTKAFLNALKNAHWDLTEIFEVNGCKIP